MGVVTDLPLSVEFKTIILNLTVSAATARTHVSNMGHQNHLADGGSIKFEVYWVKRDIGDFICFSLNVIALETVH